MAFGIERSIAAVYPVIGAVIVNGGFFDHDVGPHAGEILAVVQTAMMGKLPYTMLRDAVFTHPTMAEGLGPLFSGVPAHAQAGASRRVR